LSNYTLTNFEGLFRSTETKKLAIELALCVEAIDKLSRLCTVAEPEDQRGLAHSLFDYIVYDLDAQWIADFRLKSWADRFLTLCAGLYQVEQSTNPPCQEVGTDMPPRGIEPLFWP
jgi:hypothetical protein